MIRDAAGDMAEMANMEQDRRIAAEAERDAALAVLRQLVDKCAEIRRLELLEYGTDEYDEGLQAAIGSAYRRRNEAEDAARRLLSARR